jgi:hypothetical protein
VLGDLLPVEGDMTDMVYVAADPTQPGTSYAITELRAEVARVKDELAKLENMPVTYWRDKRISLERKLHDIEHGKDDQKQ